MILLCYAAIMAGSKAATGVLYILREAYIVLVIEQYWSFINSSLSTDSAKKLNGPITGISTLGAIGGGLIGSGLAVPLGTTSLILFAGVSLVPAALASDWGYRKAGEPAPTALERRKAAEKPKGRMGLRELRSTPLLSLILVIVILSQVISAVLYLDFQTILQNEIPDANLQTEWSLAFYSRVNALALVLNFVGVPLLMRYLPVAGVHFLIPAIHATSCAILIGSPSLAMAGAAFLLFKGFDYSLFRAAKEVLYIPLSFDSRYRAKELIDVFGYRFSKGVTALLITFVQAAGVVIAAGTYASIALIAAIAWLALLPSLRKRYRAHEAGTVSLESPS